MRQNRQSSLWVMVDVEADGPIPGDYSMTEIGAVVVEPELSRTFHGQLRPISDKWVPSALAVSKKTREQTLAFETAESVMQSFDDWLASIANGRKLMFVSDNNGFDWMFVCWYFHKFLGRNPFGHSSRNLNDLYRGSQRNIRVNIKPLRKTRHTHHPVDDAKGNAEALLHFASQLQLRF